MSSIGSRVAALRTAQGLNQAELSRRVGISQPSLHNIESGKTKTLRGATLAALCRELKVSPDTLLAGKRAPITNDAILFESELIEIWRDLNEQDRDHLLAIARALSARKKSSGKSPPPPPTESPSKGTTRRAHASN